MFNYPMRIHYHRKNGEYDTCSFVKSQDQRIDLLTYKEDYFGALFSFEHPSAHALESLNFVVHTGQTSKEYAIRFNHYPLLTEVWILEGDDRIYYSENPAIASPFYKNQNPFAFDKAINSASFDHHWGYQGELGCRVEDNQAHFALWAPTATEVQVVVYESAANDAPVWNTFEMERGNSYSYNHKDNTIGVWSLDVEEDLTGKAYQYQVQFPHHQTLTRDPYTIATSPDGKRSAILSHEEKQVANFEVKHGSEATWRLTNPCKSVICEMHIRDLTKSSTSGVDEHLRGTFLGAAQTGTVNQYGQSTAFDYIKKIGYNYVQLQPIADRHKEYDADGNVTYNWGYDPQNYNAPETSLSTNPEDPAQVIRDLKTMVQAYHDAGIGVIMDVVYNHTFSVVDAPFQTTVPDYYYRMNPDGTFQNGTGVGNETASEHEMFRKYMIDSLLYVNRVPYRTFAKEPDREPANITLQYAQNETMIDIDQVARETGRDSIYIRNYYPSLIAEQLRKETIGYITDLPLIGKVLQFLGSKETASKTKHRYARRRGPVGIGAAHQSEQGYKKYLPYVRIAWDFLRPTLVALAIGKLQDGVLGLFLGKKSRKK